MRLKPWSKLLKAPVEPERALAGCRPVPLLLDHIWTVEQVAQRCSVSTRTTRRWIEAGVLRGHRLGHLVRVSEEDLAAFLAAHRYP